MELYRFTVRYRCTDKRDYLSPIPMTVFGIVSTVKLVGLRWNENGNCKTAQRISSYYGHAD